MANYGQPKVARHWTLRLLLGTGKMLLVYVVASVAAIILVGIIFGVRQWNAGIQSRQVWALVAVGAGGDPIEVSRWYSYETCEEARQKVGRDHYARGSSLGFKCQGVKSWFELLRLHDRSRFDK